MRVNQSIRISITTEVIVLNEPVIARYKKAIVSSKF